ncbi:MAG: hypothetical protein KDD70_16395, partial [Bdellovibrionales bacterium]|nr:hypothetical protein [Bdellovibrionales bacterium]
EIPFSLPSNLLRAADHELPPGVLLTGDVATQGSINGALLGARQVSHPSSELWTTQGGPLKGF